MRLANVASIELGGQTYAIDSYFNGKPASGLAVKLAPGANALDTAQAVRDTINSLKPFFPPGMDVVYPYDTTPFVSLSIEEVFKTLAEAIVLVFLVMYLFLQNFRATIIPTLAVPVVLLGTFGVLAAFGYSINTLTMFGMVLAIGLLVDDAIVVVENVERVMAEEGLTPKQATRKSMTQITGALIGIAMVLAAVFIPMAFFGGSTGVIYRQFSITIVSSMVLSVIVAIVFTPALCATMLADSQGPSWRQARFLRLVQPYVRPQHRGLCQHGVARAEPWQAADAGLSGHRHRHGLDVHASRPRSCRMRTRAFSSPRSRRVAPPSAPRLSSTRPPSTCWKKRRTLSLGVRRQRLQLRRPWPERVHPVHQAARLGRTRRRQQKARAVAARANAHFRKTVRDAMLFVVPPPSVMELGNVTGFDFMLMDRAGVGHELAARNQLLGAAAKSLLQGVRPNGIEDAPVPARHRPREGARAGRGGVRHQQHAGHRLGFVLRQRLHRPRSREEGVRAGRHPRTCCPRTWRNGTCATRTATWFRSRPSSASWTYGPQKLNRNGSPSFNIQGQAAPGYSSGAAMQEMERLAAQLPTGVG